jgi:UDP-N-acetylglucosamine 4-epimerase
LKSNGLYNENTKITNGPERSGDVKHSLADISKITQLVEYDCKFDFNSGIKEYVGSLKN